MSWLGDMISIWGWGDPYCVVSLISSSLQPPNDPHHITRDDLILALRGVLSATPHFAEVTIPWWW